MGGGERFLQKKLWDGKLRFIASCASYFESSNRDLTSSTHPGHSSWTPERLLPPLDDWQVTNLAEY